MDTLYFLEHDLICLRTTRSRAEAEEWLELDMLNSVTKVDYTENENGAKRIIRVDDWDFEDFVRQRLLAQPYRVMRYLEVLLKYREM